jgi:hypothetical protein
MRYDILRKAAHTYSAPRRTASLLAVAAAVVLTGTACAEPHTQVGAPVRQASEPATPLPMPSAVDPQPAPPLPEAPGQPVAPPAGGNPEAQPLAGERVDGSALPEEYPREVSVVGDGRMLAILAKEGGCSRASAKLTKQSGTQVVVTLVETTPKQERACTMDIRFPTLSVTLDQPLGDREVVLRYEARTE